jgi:DNA-directed RNA polymerase subunit RPC12/RpoP
MIYYCIHCDKEVIPIEGYFDHPDRGKEKGKVCPYCGKPVMISDGRIPA